ncbi:MAG TPA: choice-of-anchor D domain-containing protein, partial [Chitinophagaceae bacterium]|nr:choice-of-anchor D domain-containing protein [Chitinophagaceae bacterium]
MKCAYYDGGNGGSGMGGGGGASDQGGGGGGYTGGSGDYLPGGSALSYNTGANQVNTDGSNNAGPNAGSILIECVGSGCPTPAFTPASQPTLSATATTICTSQSTTLSILSGAPNDATDWYWYSGSCGGTAIGSGTSIVVSPSTTTTYYARGEGTCVSPGTCANITINFQTAEIDVTGNSNPIADGSNTPLLSNHTDFNTVAAGSTQVRTFTIENTGTSNLTISSIDLSGTNAGLFTVGALSPASPIPAGSTATFTVSFLPTTTGLKTATVTINNDDCNEGAYDFAIQGTGIQATTTLSLSGPSSSTLGSANTFTATLTRVSPPAGPMAGQTVTFTIVLPNSSTSNYNATTNASGEASISYSSIMTGVHAISADFLGNATHAASTSNILSHTVCTLPAITCPGNQNANTSSSTCDAIVTYAPSSVTGSPAPTITYSFSGATTGSGSGDGSGSTFNKGTTTVTLTATNTCGSASCSFDVVVSDNVPPVITCAADVNINNTPGLCSGTTTLTPPTVTDNCSSTLGNALDFDGTGTLNHATLPPGVYFNGDFTIECWVYPKAFTNWSRIIDFGNGAGYNNILLAYTYGTSGNPGLYIEGVQIASTATLPLNQWSHVAATFSATNSIGTIYVNGVAAGTGYFNTPVNVVRNYNYVGRSNWGPGTDPDANAIYDELRIWNVERTQAEIQSTMTSELTGTETGLQIYYPFNQGITCGNNTSITDILDMAPAGGTTNATLQNFTLNGGCTSNFTNGSVSTFGLTNNAPSSYPLGNTTVTWTATDASGNTATCEQIVTVNDTEAPSITCPANISVNNTSGLCGAVVTYTAPTGTDNCPGASTTQIAGLASGATFPVGTTTNTFRVTDAAGNSATCSFTVTVIDNQVPVVTCPPAITVSVNSSCGASLYGVNPAYVVNRTQCFNPGQAAATIVAPTPGNMTGWVQTFNQYVLVSNAIAGGSYVAS